MLLFSVQQKNVRHMVETPKVESALIAELLDALKRLPDVAVDLARQSDVGGHVAGIDVQISMQVAGRSIALLIEIRKTLYPRDVRQALWQIRDAAARRDGKTDADPSVPLLAAESISPGAKELLQVARVGYFEAGGSLYLPVPGAIFFVDKPPSKSTSRAIRSLYSGRRAHVLHGLLMRREDWLGVTELAEDVSAAPSTVSLVLTELERLDWLDSRGQGPGKQRRVSQPAALLDAWATSLKQQDVEPMRRFFIPALKADALAIGLDKVCASRVIDYAVTHEAAAQRYAPFLSNVSSVRLRMPAGTASEGALGELGARSVSEGANLMVIDSKSPGDLLFRRRVSGVWLASPIQVYLDLVRSEGRAKELAEHLRKTTIGF